MVNEIITFVRGSAQEMEIGEVERHLLSLVIEVGRVALEEFVAVKGSGYAGKEIADRQGNRCPYVRERSCIYRSIFGAIGIQRAYYHAVGGPPGVFPLDAELNLPERGYSYVVQEFFFQAGGHDELRGCARNSEFLLSCEGADSVLGEHCGRPLR